MSALGHHYPLPPQLHQPLNHLRLLMDVEGRADRLTLMSSGTNVGWWTVLTEMRRAARLSQARLAESAGFDHSSIPNMGR